MFTPAYHIYVACDTISSSCMYAGTCIVVDGRMEFREQGRIIFVYAAEWA